MGARDVEPTDTAFGMKSIDVESMEDTAFGLSALNSIDVDSMDTAFEMNSIDVESMDTVFE